MQFTEKIPNQITSYLDGERLQLLKPSACNAGLFFYTFLVASVVYQYRFVEFWSQEAWSFSHTASVIFPNLLSFVGLESNFELFCWNWYNMTSVQFFTSLLLIYTCFLAKMVKI